jgi:hypothetical protein
MYLEKNYFFLKKKIKIFLKSEGQKLKKFEKKVSIRPICIAFLDHLESICTQKKIKKFGDPLYWVPIIHRAGPEFSNPVSKRYERALYGSGVIPKKS